MIFEIMVYQSTQHINDWNCHFISQELFHKLFKTVNYIGDTIKNCQSDVTYMHLRLDDLLIRHQATTEVLSRVVRNKRIRDNLVHGYTGFRNRNRDTYMNGETILNRNRKPSVKVTLWPPPTGILSWCSSLLIW